ncbi:PDR/VanB family oxidoreductase [Marinospirillum sp.]|uniref:PDR/VanB family oxidoreductase n=1 Tax=Marinospirillum sp. TaxID=2183934 RepID=UPI003A84BC2B
MSQQMTVRVADKYPIAQDTVAIELVPQDGETLPAFTAGAHIDVFLGPQTVRQYSLANDPAESNRYLLGVLKAPQSRGVSKALHDQLKPGMLLKIGTPRNVFPLEENASMSLLIGGGIGITPMLTMAWRLQQLGRPFELHLCSRSREAAPFVDQIQASPLAASFYLHLDTDGPEQRLDPAALAAQALAGSHLYVCGPAGFMDWVMQEAGHHLPEEQRHQEHFDTAPETLLNPVFAAWVSSQNLRLEVPAHQTLLDSLAEQQIFLPRNCPRGMCGSCKVRVLKGEVDHRDQLLLPEQRAEGWMLPCISRALSEELVLDL